MFGALRLWTKKITLVKKTATAISQFRAFQLYSPQFRTETLQDTIFSCLRLICGYFPHKAIRETCSMSRQDAFFHLPRRKQWVSLPPGHGGFGAITNNRQCDRDKGNALVSHVVCFWESTPEFTQEKLHFCFDLIKAKYWAIIRHLAGYAWHCNYLLRCFCLKGCIHAWNQFLHWLVKGCTFFFVSKKIRHCLLIVPLSCL